MSAVLTHPLVLASGSPRRRQLLRDAGMAFEVVVPPLAEPSFSAGNGVSPIAWAEAMAYFKARSVAEQRPAALIIGADTIVVHGKTLLGKPADRDDARRILTTMFGGANQVITGLALLEPDRTHRIITHEVTTIDMRPMDAREVEDYLETDAWRDKAGAYALQEGGDKFVKSMQGSTSNVVGLPLEKLESLLTAYHRPQTGMPT